MSYSNWSPSEPNNIMNQDCVYMRRQYQWKWVDVGCSGGIGRLYSFACEFGKYTIANILIMLSQNMSSV